MFRKILLAYDGSDGARRAFQVAVGLAKTTKAELWAVAVEEPPYYAAAEPEAFEDDPQHDLYEGELTQVRASARAEGVDVQTRIIRGHPAQAIVEFADDNGFDLIVLGHIGKSALWGVLLGSVSERISHHAKCSVLIAK